MSRPAQIVSRVPTSGPPVDVMETVSAVIALVALGDRAPLEPARKSSTSPIGALSR